MAQSSAGADEAPWCVGITSVLPSSICRQSEISTPPQQCKRRAKPQRLTACTARRPASTQETAPAAASAASLLEAVSYLQAGAYAEALNCALLAAKLAPDRTECWAALAEAHMGLGHYRAALSASRKGLQLGPSHVELHEIAEAAELLLKRTAEEKYGNLSSSC